MPWVKERQAPMLSWIARRARRRRNAHDLYGSIVALSRSHVLYAQMGVPDTVEGRFEMLLFHVFACLDRIGQISGENTFLAQDLVDVFFADMDTTSRELGVGDMAVPKKMKSLAAVYEERMKTYKQLTGKNLRNSLASALAGNIFSPEDAPAKAPCLANYVQDLQKTLSGMEIADLEAGRIRASDMSLSGSGNG